MARLSLRSTRVQALVALGALVAALAIPGRASGTAPAAHSKPAAKAPPAVARTDVITPAAPISHVVVIYQENHTFDNVLGKLCVDDHRCDGATTATLSTGATYTLAQANDFIPNVSHGSQNQQKAINKGQMNEFDKIPGCTAATGYACLTEYDPSQIPNLAALARQYVISDRTFEMDRILSWGAHLELVTTDLDGFGGEIPKQAAYAPKSPSKDWGCNGTKVTGWYPNPTAKEEMVPACVPYPDGTGTFWDTYGPNGTPQTSPVKSLPTVLDELNTAAKTWKLYVSQEGFDVCSYIAECHNSPQQLSNVVKTKQILTDAAKGALPNLSIVLPSGLGGNTSQHNHTSMAIGDNWIGQLVAALQNSPDWGSTAVFITYDDCGCFYDHVAPPNSQWGLRLPMVIVSPYAKPAYTDSTPTTFVAMIAFVEHLFGLPALSEQDADSYDYANSFDFTQTPIAFKLRPKVTPVKKSVLRAIAKSPWNEDDDPT